MTAVTVAWMQLGNPIAICDAQQFDDDVRVHAEMGHIRLISCTKLEIPSVPLGIGSARDLGGTR